VRSHVKASTAGSTKRQGKSLGRIFRGADAGRGASLEAKGTGAPKSRLLGLPLALLGVGSASAVAPTIVSTGASSVTTKAALLEAQINPEGEATSYRFEYGLADCSSNSCTSAPVPNGNVGAGSSAVKVTREIAGLSPGTTYHFRVLATNASGTAQGPDTTFKTYALTIPDTSCPNQEFRYGPGAFLPDCRAYEMVSPVDKNGGDIKPVGGIFNALAAYYQAALDGNKFTYSNFVPFGDALSARGSNQYLATRTSGGWDSHGISAPLGETLTPLSSIYSIFYDFETQFQLFTPDLSSAWVADHNETPLTPDASQGYPNLYRRDNLTESYEALTKGTPSPATEPIGPGPRYYPEVQGVSGDFSKVAFGVAGKLTPDAANNESEQVYLYSDGELHLVSVLPNGEPDPQRSHAGFFGKLFWREATYHNSVSADGTRVFWTSEAPFSFERGKVYVRINADRAQSALNGSNECTEPAKACTITVSAPSNSRFHAASADGSKALVEVQEEAGGGAYAALSLFDVDTETSTPIAGEVSGVAGTSEDLSYIYLTSKEDLDAGATAGEPNLYLYHEGSFAFIGTLGERDTGTTCCASYPTVDSQKSLLRASRVTPDGRFLAFEATPSLTGYDNTAVATGLPAREVYLYDAGAGKLICASCNPSGARPVAQGLLHPFSIVEGPVNTGPPDEVEIPAAAWLQTAINPHQPSHALASDGSRLYFNAFDALVPGDTNGIQDVYQWEAEGTGSCHKPEGCISLLSTGTSSRRSEFIDASADGRDVFIETASDIDPRDPGFIDIYDVRAGGGLQLPPPPPSPCVGDSCQSIPAAPNDPTPASAGFRGAGDPAPRKARRCRKSRHGAKKSAKAKRNAAKRCRGAKRRAGR
jgi:hypothetical protein